MVKGTYFWLKQTTSFYETKMMRELQFNPKGLELTYIYNRLMLLSVPNEGRLEYEGYGSFAQELFYSINSPMISIDGVQELLDLLEQRGLLVEEENNRYLLTEVLGYIGSQSKDALRKQRKRSANSPDEFEAKRASSGQQADTERTSSGQPSDDERTKGGHVVDTERTNVHQEVEKCPTEIRDKSLEIRDKKEKEKKKKSSRFREGCSDVIAFLNSLTGKHLSLDNEAYLTHINARLKEGYSIEDLKMVAQHQNDAWKNWDGRLKSMNPKTLYCRSNFMRYIEDCRSAPAPVTHLQPRNRDFNVESIPVTEEDLPF